MSKNLVYYYIMTLEYVPILKLSIQSLRKFYTGDIAVLTYGISEYDFDLLDVIIIPIDSTTTPTMSYMCGRFNIPYQFTSYDKILHLDCDILVQRDSNTLFELISNKVCFAAEHFQCPPNDPYFRTHFTDDDKLLVTLNPKINVGLNAGTYGFAKQHIPLFKELYHYIKNNEKAFLTHKLYTDQPFLNRYFLIGHNDIFNVDYTPHIWLRASGRPRTDQILLHFNGGIGLYKDKIEIMEEYQRKL